MGSLANSNSDDDRQTSCIFPSLTDGFIPDHEKCRRIGPKTKRVSLGALVENHETAIAAAWVLTLGKYIGTDAFSFYLVRRTESGWTSCLCSLKLDELVSGSDVLSRLHHSLHDRRESRPINSEYANTAIVFDQGPVTEDDGVLGRLAEGNFLSLHVSDTPAAFLRYSLALLTTPQADNVGSTFSHVLARLHKNPNFILNDFNYTSPEHRRQIWKFNSNVPEPWMECFHDVVQRHADERPDAPAIDAWDNKFTYAELVYFAKSLAAHLQSKGVKPGVVVPICFERSAWAIVAMLAISLAGGGYVSLPPTLPPARIDAILSIISAPLIITKSMHSHLWEGRLPWLDIEEHRPATASPASLAEPTDLFYVIFTSGSTGVPKGVMISHCNWLDGALRNAPSWKYEPDGRVLQRLSHTFDMSVLEICTTLGSGGCVCVPKAEEVEDSVAHCINKYRVTHTIGTPSLAKSLTPEQVPGLKTMCLGGEAFPKEIVTMWSERINLFQFYGPSECSINSSSRAISSNDCDPLNIGPPNSAALWVVDPRDHNKLVPIGAIGELLVSGPIVGMGYLKNPIKTAQAFIDKVDFIPENDPLFHGFRFYKTGDLVRWNADGTVSFCGRADTEVKLNGQRIELGEVEYHLALDPNVHLCMAILPRTGRCNNNLTAILTLKDMKQNDANVPADDIRLLDGRNDPAIRQKIRDIRTQLQKALPQYMVPTIWVFLSVMPMSASGKMDRVRVKSWVDEMDEETSALVTGKGFGAADRLEHTTHMECQIQQIWSEALAVPIPQIGLNQPFVALGGDSIKALEVLAKCRRRGIHVTVADILSCEGVAEAAKLAKLMDVDDAEHSSNEVVTFDDLWDQLRDGYDLSRLRISDLDAVEDVYPCTKMQEGLFLGAIRQPGSYHMRFFYKINPKNGPLPEINQLVSAWQTVVARHPSLRTVYVDDLVSDAIYHSIVLKNPSIDVDVLQISSMAPPEALSMFEHMPFRPFDSKSPQHRVTLLAQGSQVPYMMLEISHVIMDGSSQAIFLGEFVKACSGVFLPPHGPAYRDFVVYQQQNATEEDAEYWSNYMKDCSPCFFPVRDIKSTGKVDLSKTRRDIGFHRSAALIARCNEKQITLACAMRTAWSMVLRAYTGSQDVCFGYVVSLRNAPVKDVGDMFGVCICTQPCRVTLKPDLNMVDLARGIQEDYIDMVPHQHYPLAETLNRLQLNSNQPLFNTVVSMEWIPPTDIAPDAILALEEMRDQDDPAEYDLGLSIDVRDGEIKIGFLHWPWISDFEITHLAYALQNALSLFIDRPDEPIGDLSLLSAADVVKVMPGINSKPLEAMEDTVLATIARQYAERPDAMAIDSWDAQLSYQELDQQSFAIAKDLARRGVQRGDTVVFCMDRSARTIVVMMAIILAGGAFVAVSSESPRQHLERIIRQSQTRLVLADEAHVSLFEGMTVSGAAPVTVVNASHLDPTGAQSDINLPFLRSQDLAYIAYTSGSTGEPKGIMIEHASLATSLVVGQGRRLGYNPDLRVLHFISLTFDISIMEIFTTLAFGACLCIPSENERMSDLIGSMNRLQVNVAIFTPSICRLFSPADVPSLKILGLGGEAMTKSDLERFAGDIVVYNGYGPAESTIMASAAGPMKVSDDPTNIGYALDSTHLWITEVNDTQRLAPIGCVGELVIESRQLARGYANDEQRTTESFVQNLPWLGSGSRVYKTGDLVRYAEDGSLRFLGRKDTQIKLRGHRIELSHIEHHIQQCWPQAQIAVESVVPAGESKEKAILVAFLSNVSTSEIQMIQRNTDSNSDIAVPASVSSRVLEHLALSLPGYMIPSAFMSVEKMPITINGKLDRKSLRQLAERFSTGDLTARQKTLDKADPWASASELHQRLRQVWSQILGIDASEIHPDDNFFQLGGNSILAMKLAAVSRQQGISVTVPLLFRHPTINGLTRALPDVVPVVATGSEPESRPIKQSLHEILTELEQSGHDEDEMLQLAAAKLIALTRQKGRDLDLSKMEAAPMTDKQTTNPQASDLNKPFALLLTTSESRKIILDAATKQVHADQGDIEDLYPATPLQEGMISLTSRQESVYTSIISFNLSQDVDFVRLETAWRATAVAHPILRTRIVQAESYGCFQAVLRASLAPKLETFEPPYEWSILTERMGLGTPLIRIGVTKENPPRLILAMHHSTYDGWSLSLLGAELEAAYQGLQLQPRSFKPFIQYLQQSSETTAEFWRMELDSFDANIFPPLPSSPGYQATQNADLTRSIPLKASSGERFTMSTKIRLAWAVTVSRFTRVSDVVFGFTTAGRVAPVDGIESMMGPTIATIPVRIDVDLDGRVISMLVSVQDKAVQSMEHEHLGLQHISRLTASAAAACQFQTLIVLESVQDERSSASTLLSDQQFLSYLGEETYPLVLYCDSSTHGLTLRVKYDQNIISKVELSRMLDHFEHVLSQIQREPDVSISDLEVLGASDWVALKAWNRPVPAENHCVHHLFHEHAVKQPNSQAVCAWDGTFTFKELDEQATLVADMFRSHGVGPDVLVPIYFEKSRWVTVAMLAVMKAGGAFVPLDISHPSERLREIVQQVQPPFVVASRDLSEAAKFMFGTMVMTPETILSDCHHAVAEAGAQWANHTLATPDSLCYAVFTSGSTGKPKGTIVPHRGVVTSLIQLGRKIELDNQCRMFQFSSPAWDGSVLEFLAPWLFGGCVCVPSEHDRRSSLAKAIVELQANWLHCTPSVLRTLQPSSVPAIHGVVLLGEAPIAEDFKAWASDVRLFQAYGPSECSILCTLTDRVSPSDDPRDIGPASGCTCWVVDPDNHDSLVPIGAQGELVVEGPIVNRGYLNNPETTAKCFISRPAWFPKWHDGHPYQLYKTGDLVRYADDGSLSYLGRKDTQVKLNGQRMELEEVGAHLRHVLSRYASIAEVVSDSEGGNPRLAAFLASEDHASDVFDNADVRLLPPNQLFQLEMKDAEADLTLRLPPYMVPTLFIPISHIPLSSAGKTNRRLLKELATSCSAATLQRYTLADKNSHRAPSTEEERLMQTVWARVLKIEPEGISVDDDFFRIGGDSIMGMQVSTKCNSLGLAISSADLFRHRTISRLATHLAASKATESTVGATADGEVLGRWSLPSVQLNEFVERTLPNHGLSPDEIEDVYACAPVQQGILVTQARDSRYYQNRVVIEVAPRDGCAAVSAERLKCAWEQVVRRHPALRTVFMPISHEGLVDQVVLRSIEPLTTVVTEDGGLEDELPRPSTKTRPDHHLILRQITSEKVLLEWKFNHAIVDGMSLAILQRDVMLAYDGRLPAGPGPQYRQYVDFIQGLDQNRALEYWKRHLEGSQQCIVPVLTGPEAASDETRDVRTASLTRSNGSHLRSFCQQHDITMTNLFQVAWALVLRCYLAVDMASFAYQIYGRDFPARDAEDIIGPFVNMLVTNINLDPELPLLEVLRSNQEHLIDSDGFRYYSLAELFHAQETASHFNTGLSLQDMTYFRSPDNSTIAMRQVEAQDRADFDIIMNLGLDGDRLDVSLSYWTSILSESQAMAMARTFCRAVDVILQDTFKTISELDIVDEQSKAQAIQWNSVVTEPRNELGHSRILEHCLARPEAEAVCSWDGGFTYGQIDNLSTRLARHLVQLGVKARSVVPIYMEKSRWVVVAMLAIFKAGAAMTSFDISHPLARLQNSCQEVQAHFVLASVSSADSASKLSPTVIIVGDDAVDQWPSSSAQVSLPAGSPDDPFYVVFTSGSTGKPKGIVIDHRNFSSVSREFTSAQRMDTRCRVFQFASYAWDVSVQENIVALSAGGCVCIPSELERKNDIVGAMARMKVNSTSFSPSVVRVLEGEWLENIKTCVMGGEAPTPADTKTWPATTQMMNIYGPSECTIISVGTEFIPGDHRVIGKPIGCNVWIVDRRDHNKLVPLGAIGELMIEGPGVSRVGYLNNPTKTAEAFVEYPSWLSQVRNGKEERLYKTGDLVQYRSDGLVRFIGRKDNQAKLRGQRLELDEVECYVLREFPRAKTVVTDVVAPKAKGSSALLVAFVLQADSDGAGSDTRGSILRSPSEQFFADSAVAQNSLRRYLPAYMVPSMFLPVNTMPQNTSFKTDRNTLRQLVADFTQEQLSSYSTTVVEKRGPSTPMEAIIQKIVSRALDLPLGQVSMDDDFFHLGGDSVISMRAVSMARQEGIVLSVIDIFERRKISALALAAYDAATPLAENVDETVASRPISLMSRPEAADELAWLLQQHGHDASNIVDAVPTTRFQRESLDQTANHFSISIPGPINMDRLKAAIRAIVEAHEILRTVFVPFQGSVAQVILREFEVPFHMIEANADEALGMSVERIALQGAAEPVPFGTAPTKVTVISQGRNNHALLLRLSHAQYDGFSQSTLFADLSAAYDERPVPMNAGYAYADYLSCREEHKTDKALSSWSEMLQHASITTLDSASLGGCESSVKQPEGVVYRTGRVSGLSLPDGVTTATLLKAAWTLVLAKHTESHDLVFCQAVNGRSLPMEGIDRVCGPCVNIVPVRVAVQPQWTGMDLLRQTQTQHSRMMPFETVDFADIASACADWPSDTGYGSVLNHLPANIEPRFTLGGVDCSSSIHVFNIPKTLFVESRPAAEDPKALDVAVVASTRLMDDAGGDRLLGELVGTISRLLDRPEASLESFLGAEAHAHGVDGVNGVNGANGVNGVNGVNGTGKKRQRLRKFLSRFSLTL